MLKLISYQIKMSYTFWKSMVMFLAGQTLDFHVSVFFVSKFDKSYSNTFLTLFSYISVLNTKGDKASQNHRKVGQKGPLEVMQSNFSLEADGYQHQIKAALFNQVLKSSGTDSAAPQGYLYQHCTTATL